MDIEKYREKRSNLKYPVEEEFTQYWCYRKGSTHRVATLQQAQKEKERGWIIEPEVDYESLRLAHEQYRKDLCHLEEEFKQDLFKDLGIENHPLRERLYNLAYIEGHSGGENEIYNYALDMVSLLHWTEEETLEYLEQLQGEVDD